MNIYIPAWQAVMFVVFVYVPAAVFWVAVGAAIVGHNGRERHGNS